MLVATAVATAFPLILERLHIDPAVAAGPFVTTSVDIIGIFIYFLIAKIMLGL
jgi:magnesium transporter